MTTIHTSTNGKSNHTARASAALPAAGAYDTAGSVTAIDVLRGDAVELFVSYTRGAAGGAPKFKVLVSDDNILFYERTVEDGASLSSGAMLVFTAEHKLPAAASASAELRTYVIDVSTCGWAKFLFAEYGNTGSPGTLAATAALRE